MKKVFVICFLFFTCSAWGQSPVSYEKIYPRKVTYPKKIPDKRKVWVFILAGQSNMSGRGQVVPSDTLENQRVLTADENGKLVLAKEPLNRLLEPKMAELSLGTSFGNRILRDCPPGVSILLLQTAVGGSSISQWLGDSVHRGVRLYSNFKDKVALAKRYGEIKAVLWHQGESDANERDIPLYMERLKELIARFRAEAGRPDLPVLLGELGSFSKNPDRFSRINEIMSRYVAIDSRTALVKTRDLMHRGDSLHFNAEALREMGNRYAEQYIQIFYQ